MKHLKKICVMLTLLLSLAAAPAFSQNSFYMKNLDIEVGSSGKMQFILENDNFFYGFQADITFPAGVNIKISELSLSDRFDKSYKLITNVSGRVLHIAVYSSPDSDSQTPIKDNEGALFTLPFDTAPNFFGGNVEISGIKFVSESDTDVNFPDVKSPIRVYPTSISLVPNKIDLFSGFQGLDTDTIEVNYTPITGLIVKDIVWTSSDTSIADVDPTGIVTAMKDRKGTVTITATSLNNKTSTCSVNVINPEAGLTVRPKKILMEKGSTEEINAVLVLNSFPISEKAPEIEYELEGDGKEIIGISATETSNENEPTPDGAIPRDIHKVKTFKIEGKKDGIAQLIVSCTDRGTEYKDTCEIEVKTYVKNIYIDPVGPLHVGDTVTMEYEIIPEDAPLNGIKWYSSDESIATIDINTGFLTAQKLGEVLITATCPTFNGETSDSYTLKVVPIPAESITLKYKDDPDEPANPVESLEVMMQTTAQLIAEVMPVDTTDPTVTWESSNREVADVNADGLITPYRLGKTEITATCGDLSATCKVTVTPLHVSKIKLNPTETELMIGNTQKISAKVLPDAATIKDLTWTSSDDAIATVDAEGTVTAVAPGDAIITAKSVDTPKVTATCKVTVVPTPVESISLSNTELLMREGYSSEIIAIVRPDDATDKRVVWSTSDESVAAIETDEATCNITAKSTGTAIITVTSVYDPSIKKECIVTVEKEDNITAVTGITLNKYELDLIADETFNLIATITPDDATDKTVTWKSSDRSVATASQDGEVYAVGIGTATIYASSSNGLTAECAVTVHEVPVESISLSNTEMTMREGYTAELIAIVRPDNATDKDVVWSSSDESIATVDQNGIVTAIHEGNANIIAASANGVRAICVVTVVTDFIAVKDITLNKTSLTLEIEETYKLVATITPDDATDKTVTWRSSDWAIATVTQEGLVTATGAGTATIYASSSNGLTAICEVTVNPGVIPVESISLSNTELLMRKGYSSEIIAIVRPDNATDKRVVWSTSDESVATINTNEETCNITAKATGTAVITATSVYDPTIKKECIVTVDKEDNITAVTGITLNRYELDLTVDETFNLIATITPDDATDKTVTWKSSDRSIATASQDGEVYAVGVGTATIYASSSNGLTVECIVNVSPGIVEVQGISLTNTELTMREGFTAELMAIVRPDDATDKTVTWSSSDESIATVDQNGIVTAIKQGNAIVTATSANGVRARCYVTVIPNFIAVSDISINRTSIDLFVDDTYTLIATITPDDATDKTVTWRSSDWAIATVTQEGLVTAIGEGTATIYASSSNGLTVECTVNVFDKKVTGISLNESSIQLSEGETATLIATITPDYATDKTVTWTSDNTQIATVEYGIVTGVKEGTAIITATSSNGLKATCTVKVYARPLTPKQLLRKGNGTTCTFIAMMDLSDYELTELGYRFVYGYNDANGNSHVITETQLRYCHTDSEIYNDPSNDFWVFTLLENKDGVLLNSNLRHLDGSEEVCFDASKYGYPTKGEISDVASIESEDWIRITPYGIHITPNGSQDIQVAIYTTSGIQVFAKSYKGLSMESDIIDFRRFTPNTYIVLARNGVKVVTKKIVIR